ncbi:hypothetical protein ACHAPE_006728 [Trichoderma viride]
MESDAEVAAEKSLGLASAASASAVTDAVDVADGPSAAEYRKLIWKLDVHLLPPLFVLWFISLIDRVNIGTARIQGLEKDLGMNPLTNQFNIATATAKWLKPYEKAVLEERIRADGIIGRMDVLDRKAVIRCITDWKVYLSAFIIIGIISSVYSCTLFAPTIVQVLKPTYTPRKIQSLVIPIFISASISTLSFAYISDKLKHRAGIALAGCFIAIIGYIILLNQEHVSVNARYGALYLIASGSFAALPGAWILLLNNVSGSYKTAFAMGMEIGLGNGGGFVASLSFQSRDAPFYWSGFKTTFSLMCMAVGLICIYVAGLWYENKQKRAGKRNALLTEEGDNLGDAHPEFIYTY